MRRLPTVAGVVVVLLCLVACSPAEPAVDPDRGRGAGGPTSSVAGPAVPGPRAERPGAATPGPEGAGPTTGTRPAGGNAQPVCATAVRAGSTAAQRFVQELGVLLQAGADGDAGRAATAKRAAQGALDDWARVTGEQAALATDARLRKVLTDIAAQVRTLRPEVQALQTARLNRLQERLDELCGAA